MRRPLAVLALLAALPAAAAAPAGGDGLAVDLAAAAACYPRPEGSPGEAALLAHVSARLAEAGIEAARFDFGESAEGYSYSSCLSARVEGRLPDTLLIVAPLNHPDRAGPGSCGDINVALALELLRRSRERVPEVSLTVLFLGAEYGEGEGYPMGSALFLHDFPPAQPSAVLYLALGSGASPVLVRASGRGVGSPGWLVARGTAALADAGVPYRLRTGELAVDRLGLGDRRSIVEPWLKAGVPAVALEDAGAAAAGPATDAAAALAGFLDRFLALSAGGFGEEWDNHYLPITARGRTLVMGEAAWVAAVAGLLALLLLFSLVFARGLKKYARALARTGWVLVPLLGLAVAALVAATLGLEGLLALRAFPTLWTWRPGMFLAAKLAAAVLLAVGVATALPLARLGIERHASLLSAAALLLLLVDVLVVLAIDVSLTFPFLWAFCWVFLASRARRRLAKFLLFFPSALLMIAGFVETLSSPSLPLARFLLFSRWWGNLLIAVLALPFLLFLLRIGLALPVAPGRREPGRRVARALAVALPAAAAAGLGAWAALWSPFSPSSPRPVTVVQAIDADGASRLEVSSPVPLRAVTVADGGVERTLAVPGREATVELAPSAAAVAVSAQSTVSLGRANVLLTIAAPAPVRRLAAVLTGAADFVLYDCTFPFVREEEGRYRLLAGAFPPSPLSIGLTLPEGGAYRLDLELELDSPLLDVRFSAPSSRVEERVRIRARVDLPHVNPVPTVVFHVDLDAFYASVETLDDPSLAGRPVIVGALPGHRGVVSACSYEARKFGVHSAMPISQAYRRCPQAVFLPVRMERYLEVSRRVMSVLERFTPHLQQISVDEAFLDMTGTERLFGPPLATGARLKAEVRREAGLAITVGIGPNKLVAKLATNSAKPDGLREVTAGGVDAFMEAIALKDLWGIGTKTLERLSELAIGTMAQLRAFSEPELAGLLGKGAAAFLHRASHGIDPGIFGEEPQSHSLSAETTFETDRKDRPSVERALLELCHQVVFRMLDEGWQSKTAVLKLRFHDFTTTTARKTIGHWITSTEELYAVTRALLAARWDGGTPVRLVGAGCSNLERAGERGQLELFADGMERRRKVEEAVLGIRRRMGDGTVTKASLLDGRTRKR